MPVDGGRVTPAVLRRGIGPLPREQTRPPVGRLAVQDGVRRSLRVHAPVRLFSQGSAVAAVLDAFPGLFGVDDTLGRNVVLPRGTSRRLGSSSCCTERAEETLGLV